VTDWPGPITAVTLFVDDLARAKQFYGRVFDLPVHFEDDSSAVFRFGTTLINLLDVRDAAELLAPAAVGRGKDAVRFQFTLGVDDVDAMCERLRGLGVELLNGPVDRPWGIRTAGFRDPDGYVWELAH
jgi:catechol 2,3-dioxygenase-like lactoylglutathione lyase family enzyme